LLPTYLLCQNAREHFTVALSGDGGDEAFAGYRRYVGAPLAARFAGPLRTLSGLTQNRTGGWTNRHGWRRALHWAGAVTEDGASLASVYDRCMGHQDGVDPSSLWTDDARARIAEDNRWTYANAIGERRDTDPLSQMTYADYSVYLPSDILLKVDRASMAHGLEVRSPFLDHRLVEACQSLPSPTRLPRYRRKELLRRLGRARLPASAVDAPKRGFAIPVDAWFRGELGSALEPVLFGGSLMKNGILSEPATRSLFDSHAARTGNHGERLWTLVCLELWWQTYMAPSDAPMGPVTADGA
jgi:asparagine synthase (glutamine-hydrolysing)